MSVSQCVDFGILLPPNYLAYSVILGAIFGVTARPFRRKKIRQAPSGAQPNQNAYSDLHSRKLSLARGLERRLAKAAQVDDLISWHDDELIGQAESIKEADVRAVIRRCGDSPLVKVSFSEALVARQRYQAIKQFPLNLSEQELASMKSVAGIEVRRAIFYDLVRSGRRDVSAADALLEGQSLSELRLAHQLACEAMVQSPMCSRARGILLLTDFTQPGDQSELTAELIDQMAMSWPNSPGVLTRVARFAVVFPGYESASPVFARLLAIQPRQLRSLWPLMQTAPDEQALANSFPNDPEVLIDAIDQLKMSESLRERLILAAAALLSAQQLDTEAGASEASDSARAYLRGRLTRIQGDLQAAEIALAESVPLDPSRPEYRWAFALALEANGKIAQAAEQVRRCQLQSPNDRRYAIKLRELSRSAQDL